MRIFIKMHASLLSLIGIALSVLSVFFCFLNLGATSLFEEEASLFALIFGLNGERVLPGLVFAFLFLLLSIVSDFVSFLFSKQGSKKDVRFSSIFALSGIALGFLSSVLFFFSPFYTSLFSLSAGPFVVGGLILLSLPFQIPNLIFSRI